jgi:N-acyl homoserine lactone hydrolase
MKLHILFVGECCIDKGRLFTPGIEEGKRIHIPVPVFLVETDGRRVLVDTGMHPVHIDDPDHTFGNMPPYNEWILPMMRPEDRLEHRLGEIGLKVEDITDVVNTHLHFDHCGQNYLFPHAQFYVQREQYELALEDPGYPSENFDLPDLNYELLDGDDVELFPGVRIYQVPGHVAGLQALLFSLPNSGNLLLAGDAIDTREHLEDDLWDHCMDPVAAKESAEKLKRLAEEKDAMLLFGHDLEQWKTLKRAPAEYYD